MKRLTYGLFIGLLFLVTACGGDTTPAPAPTATVLVVTGGQGGQAAPTAPSGQTGQVAPTAPAAATDGPPHITVQHILIAFAGTGTKATRTQAEAQKLANDLLAQVKNGGDFDALMKKYSDDNGPGIYSMANNGVAATSADEILRNKMIPAFGNVGFKLQVGEIGIANYDAQTSPYGWHIIKRLAGPPPTPTPLPTVPVSTGPLPKFMIVETAKGTFTIQLYTDPADKVENVVRNFADKARAGYFDGLIFHRVEAWVVQGGDPAGTGGGSIPSQYNQQPFVRGSVGVASTKGGGPTINASQWFVLKNDAAQLNGQYANFGMVVAGMAVVDKLAVGDKMTKVTVADTASFNLDPTRTPVPGPAHISVQHILIGFQDPTKGPSIPGKTTITRTQEMAKALAADVLAQAKAGANFDDLVKKYTDDQAPGIYNMSNIGATPDQAAQEYPRDQMVPAFGNIGFNLQVGEIGMAEYDTTTSPFGWHIIKRLK